MASEMKDHHIICIGSWFKHIIEQVRSKLDHKYRCASHKKLGQSDAKSFHYHIFILVTISTVVKLDYITPMARFDQNSISNTVLCS
jgi:pyruvate dehydrogenase complex dehydrogenase (E1) component